MRKSLRRLIPTFLFMIMCLTILTPEAMAAENPKVKLRAKVVLKGAKPDKPEDYTIKLSADVMTNPMPKGSLNGTSTMIVKGDETVTFPEITYTSVGIYKYTIQQESGSNPDARYDNTIYHLSVIVTNAQNGGLEVTALLNEDGQTKKLDEILFENSYSSPATVKFQALKTLDGKTPDTGAFFFHLKDKDGKILQTKSNKERKVEFDEIQFNKAGSYTFYISEKIEASKLIKYDEAVYTALVKVTKNTEGNYEAEVSYTKYDKPYEETPTFDNKTKTEIPNAGVTESAFPIIGVVMLLLGIVLLMRRRATE